jgi:toxin secretion/phage lysis holin
MYRKIAIVLSISSSEIGFKGIIKKVMILCLVAMAVFTGKSINEEIPFREIVIIFFLCNEVISIMENAAVMLPIPQKIKDFFLQLRDKTGGVQK